MGDIADSIIDGEFDYITGEYIGPGVGYPRTYESSNGGNYKKVKAIRKELAALIKEKQELLSTEKEKNHAITLARQFINEKYGKNWRTGFFKM